MKFVIKNILLFSLMLFPFILSAQPPDNPPATPIDGGVGFLLAAGIAYGITKIRKKKKM